MGVLVAMGKPSKLHFKLETAKSSRDAQLHTAISISFRLCCLLRGRMSSSRSELGRPDRDGHFEDVNLHAHLAHGKLRTLGIGPLDGMSFTKPSVSSLVRLRDTLPSERPMNLERSAMDCGCLVLAILRSQRALRPLGGLIETAANGRGCPRQCVGSTRAQNNQ